VKSDGEELVLVPNVRAISDGLTLMCELADKRRVGVPLQMIGSRSEVRRPGDVGTLAVPRWFATDHELLVWN
jgi:hypothetical protein